MAAGSGLIANAHGGREVAALTARRGPPIVSLMEQVSTLPVAVILERRKIDHPWQSHRWQAVEILAGQPAATPWTQIAAGEGWERYHAGTVELAIYHRETESYKYNLESTNPSVYVVLRPSNDERGIMLHTAIVGAGEAHAYAETNEDMVEAVPMPDAVRAWVSAFVEAHHVEQVRYKRQRDRADPEALAGGRKPGGRHE